MTALVRIAFRRILATPPMLLAVALVSFLLLHALPGDPARAVLGQRATEENVRQFRESEGLDDPLALQFGRFLERAVQGDFGRSHRTNRPVVEELGERIPATIELAVAAMLVAAVFGIGLGILAAVRPRGFADFVCLAFALTGVSMPVFWLGFLAQKTIAGNLGWLPFGARLDPAAWPTFESVTGFNVLDAAFVYRNVELTVDVLRHLTLPSLVLATVPMALIARMTRSNMIEALGRDFIRTARAKGTSPIRIVLGHAMPNALIPIVTALGSQFGYLLGGAVLTETIFGWPGLGVYTIESITVLDVRPLQATVMVVGMGFMLINLLTDLSYTLIDPRLRDGTNTRPTGTGPGWHAAAPWLLAATPWFGLAAVTVLARSGRVAPDSRLFTTLFPVLCGLVALEVVAAGILAARRGSSTQMRSLLRDGLSAAQRATTGGLLAFRKFAAFARHHRPAAVGLGLVLILAAAAILASSIAPYDPMHGTGQFNAPSGKQFLLGSDAQGRDIFSRLVWGARYTLLVALAATCVSLAVGTLIGMLSGFFGGAVDSIFMRATDFLMSFPSFLLAVVTAAILGKSLENLMWAVGVIGIPVYARQMRAEVLRVKALEFVDAAYSLGASPLRILIRTVLPNCLTPLIVLTTLGIGSAILDIAGLAFLGLGGDPFIPEWGLMLKLGWDESAKGAFQVTVSGACILAAVMGFNLLGDGLRDWLDPRRSKAL